MRFALDHNFPRPIVETIRQHVIDAELVPIDLLDPSFPTLSDARLLLAVFRRKLDGLVTMDADFLKPQELVILEQTRLTVIIADGVGHDPVRALGLLLHKLGAVCGHDSKTKGQLWVLRSGPVNAIKLSDSMRVAARRAKTTVEEMRQQYQLTPYQLSEEPLEQVVLGDVVSGPSSDIES